MKKKRLFFTFLVLIIVFSIMPNTHIAQEQPDKNTSNDARNVNKKIKKTEMNNLEEELETDELFSEKEILDYEQVEVSQDTNDDEQKENSLKDYQTIDFNDTVFKRDLSHIDSYVTLLIDNEMVMLTNEEYNEFEDEILALDESNVTITKAQVYSILKNIILKNQKVLVNKTISHSKQIRTGTGAQYFNWNNWQTNSKIQAGIDNGQHTKLFKDGNVWQMNIRNKYRLSELNDNKPIFFLKNTRFHVKNGKLLTNEAQYNLTYSHGNNGYYDLKKEERANANLFRGILQYKPELFQDGKNRMAMITKMPGHKSLYFHPENSNETLDFNVSYRYKTTEKNGHNDNMTTRMIVFKTAHIQPQVVKAVHVDRYNKKEISDVESYGVRKSMNDRFQIWARDYSEYNYKNYEVYVDGNLTNTSEAKGWNGSVSLEKRGLVFYYDKVFNVKFDSKGGTKVSNQKVERAQKVVKPVNPPKNGNKQFEGWYIDEKYSQKYNFENEVHSDMTLYAKWKEPRYFTVKFDSNGGTEVNSQEVEEGKKALDPGAPKFNTKKFKGWYIDSNFSEPYNFSEPVNKNMTLYAKWESPIVNPENGKTPVIPLDPENQNKRKDGLRIQYVSELDFGTKKNIFKKEIGGHAEGDIVIENGKEKIVPAFISIIDDRPTASNNKGWELRASSGPFVANDNTKESINRASIHLSELNYASNLETSPSVIDGKVNISEGLQLLSDSGNTKGGTWSLAFGFLDEGKTSGASLIIPKGTSKKSNADYYATIKWELTPSLGGR